MELKTMHNSSSKKPHPSGPSTKPGFVKWFRHYRTGKIYYAEDYGHEAWPIGKR